MLEGIHPGADSLTDFFGAVGVGYHVAAGGVRGVDDGLQLLERHLVLVNHLDEVDPGVDELLGLGARVLRPVHFPAELGFERRGFLLQEGSAHKDARAGDVAAGDAVAHRDAVFERSADVTHRGDTRHQQLLGGDGHDDVAEAVAVNPVPMVIVGVAEDHQVDVHVHQPGQHGVAFG